MGTSDFWTLVVVALACLLALMLILIAGVGVYIAVLDHPRLMFKVALVGLSLGALWKISFKKKVMK